MSTMNQIRAGIHKAWDSLTVGWRELRELAGEALTRFQPKTSADEADSAEKHIVNRSSRWGLLAAEVTDDDDSVLVVLEVPGLSPDDFDIEAINDLLVVRGEKKVSREERKGHYHIMERAYGQFERAIRLPAAVTSENSTASYRAGVLTVTLPKNKTTPKQRIVVAAH